MFAGLQQSLSWIDLPPTVTSTRARNSLIAWWVHCGTSIIRVAIHRPLPVVLRRLPQRGQWGAKVHLAQKRPAKNCLYSPPLIKPISFRMKALWMRTWLNDYFHKPNDSAGWIIQLTSPRYLVRSSCTLHVYHSGCGLSTNASQSQNSGLSDYLHPASLHCTACGAVRPPQGTEPQCKDFTASLAMHFVWKSGKAKKTPIWNCISFWTGLDRTLASKLEGHFPSTQNDPVTTGLQNIQPDHTVTIWKRNHLFFAVPVPMVQLWTDLGSQGFIDQRCPWGCLAGSGLFWSV